MTTEQLEKIAWLNRAFYAEKKLKALESLRESDRERTQRITAVYGGNDKGKSDGRVNGVEDALITLAGSIEKYDRFLKEYNTTRKEIEMAIEGLESPREEALLIYRYLGYLSMEDIAEKMHYSTSTVKRIHRKAIEKMTPNEP